MPREWPPEIIRAYRAERLARILRIFQSNLSELTPHLREIDEGECVAK